VIFGLVETTFANCRIIKKCYWRFQDAQIPKALSLMYRWQKYSNSSLKIVYFLGNAAKKYVIIPHFTSAVVDRPCRWLLSFATDPADGCFYSQQTLPMVLSFATDPADGSFIRNRPRR
jgi:hypothetical protein